MARPEECDHNFHYVENHVGPRCIKCGEAGPRADENKLQIVPDDSVHADDLKLLLSPDENTVVFNAGDGVVVKARNREGGDPWRIDGELSDEIKARLAHLEAIEAAMAKADSFIEGEYDNIVIQLTNHRNAETALHDLIREGMKDNAVS